jgi:3-hydroxyacyl-CoA dehydrogenase
MIKHIIILLAFVAIDIGIANIENTASNFAVEQPRSVRKVQKKKEKKEKAERKATQGLSKATQKRAYEIQSPEVKKRMKQNKKDIAAREKTKKRQNNSKTKTGARKYR